MLFLMAGVCTSAIALVFAAMERHALVG